MPSVHSYTLDPPPDQLYMAQAGNASTPADETKKKTKLGYHRQSIACVFCRRRKIRCITTDPDCGKCDTCLKLGKECHFLKVNDAIALDHVTPVKRNKRAQSFEQMAGRQAQRQSWSGENFIRAYESSPMQAPPQGRVVFKRDIHRPGPVAERQPREDWSNPVALQHNMPLQRPVLPHRHTEPTSDGLLSGDVAQANHGWQEMESPLTTPNDLLTETFIATQPYFGPNELYSTGDHVSPYDQSSMTMARSVSQPQDLYSPYYSAATSERSHSIDGHLTMQPEEGVSSLAPEALPVNNMASYELELYQQYQQGISSQSSPLQYSHSAATSNKDYGRQQSPFLLEQGYSMHPQGQTRSHAVVPMQMTQSATLQPQAYQMVQGQRAQSARSTSAEQQFIHYQPGSSGRKKPSR